MANASQLKAKTEALKAKKDEASKNLARFKKDLAANKGRKDAQGKAKTRNANAYIKLWQERLNDYTKQLTTTQNQYYEASGQYDKLLKGQNRDAYMALNSLFNSYGLGSLSGKVYDYVKNGYSADTISILLQDTPEYKKRFAGNEARQKAGLSVLSPAEYISVESSYRQIMKQSGLPAGFYDSNDDFTKWIATDLSPTELQSRVDLATQATTLANPTYKAALKQMGLSDGDLTAYFLDQKKALPYLQKTAATAAIGAEALQRGLTFDKKFSEDLATQGVTRDQAAAGYARIADEFSDLKTLGQIYGGGWTQRQGEESTFIGGTAATQQKNRLIGNEKGSFSGGAGGASGGLAQSGGAR